MNLKTLFTMAAVVTIAFGLGFMFLPAPISGLYGLTLDPGGLLFAQLFGALLVGFAIVAWYARAVERSDFLNGVLLAFFVSDLFGFLFSLWALMGGIVNDLGLSTVVIYGFFTIGFGYFRFAKSDNSDESAPDEE